MCSINNSTGLTNFRLKTAILDLVQNLLNVSIFETFDSELSNYYLQYTHALCMEKT